MAEALELTGWQENLVDGLQMNDFTDNSSKTKLNSHRLLFSHKPKAGSHLSEMVKATWVGHQHSPN
jgi:hypothetical protein